MWLANSVRQRVACLGVALMMATGSYALAEQTHFPSPDEAVKALVEAVQAKGDEALFAVLGPEAREVINSGDVVADQAARRRFADAAAKDIQVKIDQNSPDSASVTVGKDHWPFPIPLVKDAEGWRFDTAAGQQELINRRVGRNELYTISIVRAYVDAQYEYASANQAETGVREYAQKFMSSDGRHDGLYWPAAEGEKISPLGPLVASATAEGYELGKQPKRSPYHGYYFRILKAQGKNAPGGAKSYLDKDGRLTGGFALIAYPVDHGNSGVMSFIVNQQDLVFQKDLGEDTEKAAEGISEYDPDETWDPVPEH